MSRAFVKEDAPEALPVRTRGGGLPPGTPNLATPGSVAALRAELAAMQDERRGLAEATDGIGLERRRVLDAEIRALDGYLGTLEVVTPPAAPVRVGFGTAAVLSDGDGERIVRIVGVDEADPAAGRISFVSPLARALFGAVAGDEVVVPRPGGDEPVEVVAVLPLDAPDPTTDPAR